MRNLMILTGVVWLSFMLLPACAPQPEQQAEPVVEESARTEADVTAIKAVFKQYDDAVTAGDLEGFAALFVEDCIVLPPNAAILVGKDRWHSWTKSSLFDQFDMEETITVEETEIAGDWAFARGAYTWRATPKAGGETVEEVGKGIMIFERQSDGSWKISHNIWNSDNPPSAEPAT